MKLLYKINLILLIVLSLATGVSKILQQEADIKLFKVLGMTDALTAGLGIVQVAGGALLVFTQTWKYGALLMMATFVLASTAVFMNGMIVFGAISLLFILMACWVYFVETRKSKQKQ